MVNWKVEYVIGDREIGKADRRKRKRGESERRVYGVPGTGELGTVMRLYASGTGDKAAHLGVLWNRALFELSYIRGKGVPRWRSKGFEVR